MSTDRQSADSPAEPTRSATAGLRRLFGLIALVALATAPLGCSTDEGTRFWCLERANRDVQLPEVESKQREAMVHELYLRCIEAYHVPDTPVPKEPQK